MQAIFHGIADQLTHLREFCQQHDIYINHINMIPLTDTRSTSHMRDDFAIADFELSPSECLSIGKLFC